MHRATTRESERETTDFTYRRMFATVVAEKTQRATVFLHDILSVVAARGVEVISVSKRSNEAWAGWQFLLETETNKDRWIARVIAKFGRGGFCYSNPV